MQSIENSEMENQLIHSSDMDIRVGSVYHIEPSVFDDNTNDLHNNIKTEPPDEFETIGAHGAVGPYEELMSSRLASDPSETMDTHLFDRIKIEPQDSDTSQQLAENRVRVKSEPVSDDDQFNSGDLTQTQDFGSYPKTIDPTCDTMPITMQGIPPSSDIEKIENCAGNSIGSSRYPVGSGDLSIGGTVKIEPLEDENGLASIFGTAEEYNKTSSQHLKVKNEREPNAGQSAGMAAFKSTPRFQNTGTIMDKTVIFVNLDKLKPENTSSNPGAETDEAPIFICDDCNQSFRSYTELIQHQTFHVSDAGQKSYKVKLNLTIFRCEKCGGNFCDSKSLSQHWDVCNNEARDDVFEGLFQESSLEDGQEKEPLESGSICACLICEKTFSSVEALLSHREVYGHNQCRKCYTMFSNTKFVGRHVCNAGKNLIQCCSCACLFERKEAALYSPDLSGQSVQFHDGLCDEYIDSGGEGLGQKCNQCSEKVFKCGKCNNAFKSCESLKRHDEKAHPNSRTYNCKFCAKMFERKDSLICHEAIHRGIYNNARSSQNVEVKDRKIRKKKKDDTDYSPYRARRGGKVGRGGRGPGKLRNKAVTLCYDDSDTPEDPMFSSHEKAGPKLTISQSAERVDINGLWGMEEDAMQPGDMAEDLNVIVTGAHGQSKSKREVWYDDHDKHIGTWKSKRNSANGVYHVSRRTCMAVLDNGEYCTGKYKIDLSDNERRCQKCGSKPR